MTQTCISLFPKPCDLQGATCPSTPPTLKLTNHRHDEGSLGKQCRWDGAGADFAPRCMAEADLVPGHLPNHVPAGQQAGLCLIAG